MNTQQVEHDVAKEIFNIGMAKAAESLSFFTKDKVVLEYFDFKVMNEAKELDQFVEDAHIKDTILVTEVMGDMKGVSYLLFNEEEANGICEKALPAEIVADPAKFAMLSEAILLEIDNIVSAAAITQFSNLLNTKMYGNVPQLIRQSFESYKPEFMDNINEYFAFCFKVKFSSGLVNVRPWFIWFMDKSFMEKVAGVIDNENVIQKIKTLKSK